jgi:transmembrane sensor
MSNTLRNRHLASIDEQAAIWFSRLCRGLSDDEQAQLDAWLTADVAHVYALRTMQGVWAELDLLPRPPLTSFVPRPRQTRRRWMPGRALAACALLLGTALVAPQHWLSAPATQALSLNSAPNEQRQVELADGSRIDLNVDTRLQVRLHSDRREVELLAGEAS